MGDSTGGLTEAFAGMWCNIDDQDTDGLIRLDIRAEGEAWAIRKLWRGDIWNEELTRRMAKTACDSDHPPEFIPPPFATLHLLADSVGDSEMKYGLASWDLGYCDVHLMLRLEGDELIAEDFTVFRDGSGRSNFRTLYKFKKFK